MTTGRGPDKLPDANIARQAAALARMKTLALALLLAMLVLLVLSAAGRLAYPWLDWVHAFAEAAVVGAIADWFAVTALFRRPLGLPIPHTAIIPNNKGKIGVSLGRFVEQNFLTPDNIVQKLRQANLARAAALWLGRPDNACEVADHACALLPSVVAGLDDHAIQDFLERTLTASFERLDKARLVADVIAALTAGRGHQLALNRALQGVETWMIDNRELLEARFSAVSKYTPGFFDRYVVGRFLAGVTALLHEIDDAPDHDIRLRIDEAIAEFVMRLRTSPDHRAQVDRLSLDLLAHLKQQGYYPRVWRKLRAWLLAGAAGDQPVLQASVRAALIAVSEALLRDDRLQAALNEWVLGVTEGLVVRHRHQVSQLITEVLARWDARSMGAKLELEIGSDLQFIRINGTLVGGAVGLVLNALSRQFAS